MKLGQKGVSPLIATILLVAISLAIAGMLYSWMAQYATTQTSKYTTSSGTQLQCSQAGGIQINSCTHTGSNFKLQIESTGDIDLNGFTIAALYSDGNATNTDANKLLKARSYLSIDANLWYAGYALAGYVPVMSNLKVVPKLCPSNSVTTTTCS